MFSRLFPLNPGDRLHGVWVLLWVLVMGPMAVLAAEAPPTWADKMLSVRQHDFGSPAMGTEAKTSIKISNIYKETVTISEVVSSSSEVKARIDKSTLESKGIALLEVTLDATAFGKKTDAVVTMKMTFDGVTFKTVTVPVTAFPKQTIGRNWAEQMFSELRVDLGSVARGAEVKRVITITNLYKEDVTLSPPATSCHCISPQLDKFVLKSKETAHLTLTLDTVGFKGKRDITVSLTATFDNLNFKSISIPITAFIRQDVVFEPGSVQFGVLAPGEAVEKHVRVIYAGRNNWTVQSVRGSNSNITSEIHEVSRANGRVEYDLLVKLAGSAPLGPVLDQIVLGTDDALNPTIPILVSGSVEADLSITPEVVQFGTLKPGVSKVFNVVAKGRKPFRIDKVECDSSRGCYQFSTDPVNKTVHVFKLTIDPPNEPGELKEGFSVTIAGRSVPLTFQGVGTIEAPEAKPAAATPASGSEPAPETKDSVPAAAGTPP